LCILTHTKPSDEVILSDDCHIIQHEVGAAGLISGVQLRTIECDSGMMPIKAIKKRIRGTDIHYPLTRLICIENAHGDGVVLPLDYMASIRELADEHGISIHLDGARLFNAATYLDTDVKEITKHVDTVMFCLSKGLCAPVGSLIAGSKAFIDKARKNRKLMGGGMRQVGVLAAPGLIALRDMRLRLHEDHENATTLAKGLNHIKEIDIDKSSVHINLVFFNFNVTVDEPEFINYMSSKGIIINGSEHYKMRFATNNGVSQADIERVLRGVEDFFDQEDK
ncbi:MAG: GntG family PLP-dependent aldolase, partial [Vallitaleaceae bacterium]|nr:GntG family PLP-dependent aldolase [Vallitaleaceae bacterium]